MKSNLALIFAAVLLFLMPLASAALSISSNTAFSALHNSILQIPLIVNSTTNITNMSMTVTNISNAAQILPVTITDPSKLSIAANQTKDYTINYNIAQYLAAGAY